MRRRKRVYKYDDGKAFVISLVVVGAVIAGAVGSGWVFRAAHSSLDLLYALALGLGSLLQGLS